MDPPQAISLLSWKLMLPRWKNQPPPWSPWGPSGEAQTTVSDAVGLTGALLNKDCDFHKIYFHFLKFIKYFFDYYLWQLFCNIECYHYYYYFYQHSLFKKYVLIKYKFICSLQLSKYSWLSAWWLQEEPGTRLASIAENATNVLIHILSVSVNRTSTVTVSAFSIMYFFLIWHKASLYIFLVFQKQHKTYYKCEFIFNLTLSFLSFPSSLSQYASPSSLVCLSPLLFLLPPPSSFIFPICLSLSFLPSFSLLFLHVLSHICLLCLIYFKFSR